MRAFHRYWFNNRVYELEPRPAPDSADLNLAHVKELKSRLYVTLSDKELRELQDFWLFYRDILSSLTRIMIEDSRYHQERNIAGDPQRVPPSSSMN